MRASFAIAFLLLASYASALESSASDLIASMTTEPSDAHAGKLSIIGFDFRGADGVPITHIDGYVSIYKGDEPIVKDYYLHTHNDDFSMLHTFAYEGVYRIVVSVKPSEHYKGLEFRPGNATFEILVKPAKPQETKHTGYGQMLVIAGIAVTIAAAIKSLIKK